MKKLLIWMFMINISALIACNNSVSEKKKPCFVPKTRLSKGATLNTGYSIVTEQYPLPTDTASFEAFRKQKILAAAESIDDDLIHTAYHPYAIRLMSSYLGSNPKKVLVAAELKNNFFFYLDEEIDENCTYKIILCVVKRAGEEALEKLK